jgi:hypothetical protein
VPTDYSHNGLRRPIVASSAAWKHTLLTLTVRTTGYDCKSEPAHRSTYGLRQPIVTSSAVLQHTLAASLFALRTTIANSNQLCCMGANYGARVPRCKCAIAAVTTIANENNQNCASNNNKKTTTTSID